MAQTVAILVVLALNLVACVPSNSPSNPAPPTPAVPSQKPLDPDKDRMHNAAEILDNADLSKDEKADKLASMAEDLLIVQAYPEAVEVAELALKMKRSHALGGWVRAVASPYLPLRGFLVRTKNFKSLSPEHRQQLEDELAAAESTAPTTNISAFVSASDKSLTPILTEAEFQSYMDELIKTYQSLNVFARRSRSNKEVLNVRTIGIATAPWGTPASLPCRTEKIEERVFRTNCQDPVNYDLRSIRLNQADFESLIVISAGLELALSLANSYDLSGSPDFYYKHEGTPKKDQTSAWASNLANQLIQIPGFGTLRKNHVYSKIKTLGADGVEAFKWIIANQRSICPKTRNTKPGAGDVLRSGFLFEKGICFDDIPAANKQALDAEDFVTGKTIYVDAGERYYDRITIEPAALDRTPFTYLGNLFPITTNSCGQVTSTGSEDFEGLFPGRNMEKYLRWVASPCPPR